MGKQRKKHYGGRAVKTPLRKKAKRGKAKPTTSKLYSGKPLYRVDPQPVDHDATLKPPVAVNALRG